MKKKLSLCVIAAALAAIPSIARAQAPTQIDEQGQRNAIAIYTLCYITRSEDQMNILKTTVTRFLNQQNPGKQPAVDGFMSGPFDKELRAEAPNLAKVFQQESATLSHLLTQDEVDKLVNACLIPTSRMKTLPPEFFTKVVMIGAPYIAPFTQALLKELQPQLQASSLAVKLD